MTTADAVASLPGRLDGGRSFAASRRVRLGDVTPDRRLRLDAAARYLQDVAADDVREAGLEGAAAWVVRRTELRVRRRPAYNEPVDLVTWCSGTGAAWAERRTTLTDEAGPLVEGCSLWVSLDPRTMRPAPLDEAFFAVYGEGARARTIKARLHLPQHPPADASRSLFPLRRADFDLLDHVNNAVAWAVVEQDAHTAAAGRPVVAATLEYREPIRAEGALTVAAVATDEGRRLWLLDQGGTAAVVADIVLADPPA